MSSNTQRCTLSRPEYVCDVFTGIYVSSAFVLLMEHSHERLALVLGRFKNSKCRQTSKVVRCMTPPDSRLLSAHGEL